MSQIVTNLEQSKRLLEAGLDPRSADFYWKEMHHLKGLRQEPPLGLVVIEEDKPIPANDPDCCGWSFTFTPAWSLSRLLDIHGGYNAGIFYDSESLIESLVKSIVFLIDFGDIDSKWLVK